MAKLLVAEAPFLGWKIYGPYLDRKQNRKIVVLVGDGHRTTMSYARYLLSVREGSVPVDGIDADHVDDDSSNDSPENIQPLTRAANIAKGHAARKPATTKSPTARLTEEQVLAIYASSESCRALACKHGITPMTVSRIKRRLKWQYLLAGSSAVRAPSLYLGNQWWVQLPLGQHLTGR